MERILIFSIVVYVVASAGICLIRRLDDSSWELTFVEKCVLFAVSSMNGIVLRGISGLGRTKVTEAEYIFLALFAGCLLFACITDFKQCVVFQFTWWVAVVALGGWGAVKMMRNGWSIVNVRQDTSMLSHLGGLFLYIMLQECFFSRMYGRADCHGFSLCAVAEYLCGINMSGYVYHMAIAFGMLGVVQVVRKNVNCKGNLKKPVAFLPYITVAFWLWLYIAFFPK